MKLREVQENLFNMDSSYHLAHCISSDYALGAGIAVEFNRIYDMRSKLQAYGVSLFPSMVLIDNVFNLITKERYWHKPTYDSLEESLVKMKEIIVRDSITHLAMPRIGSGLDRLEWGKVKSIIEKVFADTSLDIVICYI